jgi:GxxExxY protein
MNPTMKTDLDSDVAETVRATSTLTEKVIGAAFAVAKELGHGFLESVYHNALGIALANAGLSARSQVRLSVSFRGAVVGEFFADYLINDTLIVELKACSDFAPEHYLQVMNYLRAGNYPIGLLLNFGRPRILYKRILNPNLSKPDQPN